MQASSLFCHYQLLSLTTLCWNPAHMLINLCHRSAMSFIGTDLFLHHSPHVVINWIQVQAVWWTINSGVS